MTADRVSSLLIFGQCSDEMRCELSDWAVNTLRDAASAAGWTRDQLLRMMTEEGARIAADDLDLIGYLRVCRTGSEFILSRQVRMAVYAQLKLRAAR